MNLKVATEFDLGFDPMHCVSTNVKLKDGQGMLFVVSEGGWCDPGEELFRTKRSGKFCKVFLTLKTQVATHSKLCKCSFNKTPKCNKCLSLVSTLLL